MEELNKVYEAYRKKINKGTRFTVSAKTKVRSRLKEFSFKELHEAIDKFSRDKWRMENNSTKGMVWFFDSEEKVAKWLALEENNKIGSVKVVRRSEDDKESDLVDAQLRQRKFIAQSPKEKSAWWFRYSFATYYGLADGLGLDYEKIKERIGKDKLKEIYIFIFNWYKNNPRLHSPVKSEYMHFLPKHD